MARPWTLEDRQRQAALIQRWRPWEYSTGPRTDEGKVKASDNAFKHGGRSAVEMAARKQIRVLLKEATQLLERIA